MSRTGDPLLDEWYERGRQLMETPGYQEPSLNDRPPRQVELEYVRMYEKFSVDHWADEWLKATEEAFQKGELQNALKSIGEQADFGEDGEGGAEQKKE